MNTLCNGEEASTVPQMLPGWLVEGTKARCSQCTHCHHCWGGKKVLYIPYRIQCSSISICLFNQTPTFCQTMSNDHRVTPAGRKGLSQTHIGWTFSRCCPAGILLIPGTSSSPPWPSHRISTSPRPRLRRTSAWPRLVAWCRGLATGSTADLLDLTQNQDHR